MTLYFSWSRIALVYGWTFTSSSRKKDKKYCHRQARQRCVMEFIIKQSIDHEKLLLATVSKNRTFLNNGLAFRKCLFFFYHSIYKCVCIVEPRRKQTFDLPFFFFFSRYRWSRRECRLEFETNRFERKTTPIILIL